MSDAPSPASPAPIIGGELFCIGCGYDLQSRPLSGRCPECGGAVEDSLHAFPEPTAARKALILGAIGLICGTIPVVILFKSIPLSPVLPLLCGSVLFAAAAFLLGRRCRLNRLPAVRAPLRRLEVAAAAGAIIDAALGVLHFGLGLNSFDAVFRADLPLQISFGAVLLAAPFGVMVRGLAFSSACRASARRAGREPIARSLAFAGMLWAAAAAALLVCIAILVSARLEGGEDVPAAAPTAMMLAGVGSVLAVLCQTAATLGLAASIAAQHPRTAAPPEKPWPGLTVTFTLTLADYVMACRLMERPLARIAVGAALLLAALAIAFPHRFADFAVGWVLFLCGWRFLMDLVVNPIVFTASRAGGDYSVSFDETGFSETDSNAKVTRYPWTACGRMFVNRHCMAIVLPDVSRVAIIPKRFLSAGQTEDLTSFAKSRIGPAPASVVVPLRHAGRDPAREPASDPGAALPASDNILRVRLNVTLDDFCDGMRHYYRVTPIGIVRDVLMVLFATVVVHLLNLSISPWVPAAVWCFSYPVGLLLFGPYLLYPWFYSHSDLRGECTAAIDARRFSLHRDGMEIFWGWDDFKSVSESAGQFVLHSAHDRFLVIPKRLLTGDQLGLMKNWLKPYLAG